MENAGFYQVANCNLHPVDEKADSFEDVRLECLQSSEFVLGKQNIFNGPVTIISCREAPGEKNHGNDEKLIIKDKLVSPSMETNEDNQKSTERGGQGGKKEKWHNGTSGKLTVNLKIFSFVCMGILLLIVVGLGVFFATTSQPTDETQTTAWKTASTTTSTAPVPLPTTSTTPLPLTTASTTTSTTPLPLPTTSTTTSTAPVPLPTTSTTPSTTKRTVSPTHSFYTKQDWGGQPPISSVEMKLPVPYVVISHTVTPRCFTLESCAPLLRSIQRNHFRLKYADISCNFFLDSSGNIYEARGWNKRNAMGGFVNGRSIDVGLMGDYSEDVHPTDDLMDGLRELLEVGVERGKIAKDYSLLPANLTVATLSPGKNVYAVIKNWSHFDPDPKSHLKE